MGRGVEPGSTLLITNKVKNSTMSESIYNLVPEPYVEPEKTQIYRSKYDPSAPLTGSSFG